MTPRPTTPSWYAVYTRSRFEKRVAAALAGRSVEHFLPLRPTVRRWKDREKTVLLPVFSGYLFVRVSPPQRRHVLSTRGVVRILGVNGEPTPVPDIEIQNVRRLLARPDLLELDDYVEEGDWVEIVRGPFSGVRGRLLQRHGRHRLVVGVELIRQAISVSVDSRSVRRVRSGGGRVGRERQMIA